MNPGNDRPVQRQLVIVVRVARATATAVIPIAAILTANGARGAVGNAAGIGSRAPECTRLCAAIPCSTAGPTSRTSGRGEGRRPREPEARQRPAPVDRETSGSGTRKGEHVPEPDVRRQHASSRDRGRQHAGGPGGERFDHAAVWVYHSGYAGGGG